MDQFGCLISHNWCDGKTLGTSQAGAGSMMALRAAIQLPQQLNVVPSTSRFGRVPRGLIPPHILSMTQWQKTTREPKKTKAELYEMLAEAVRNTQAQTKRPPRAKRDRG
jgi:hypothetical protein